MKTANIASLSILGLSLTLFSCGGGGGGGATGSSGNNGSNRNEGAYSAEEFGYDDPHPASFHPLGTSSTVLRQRSELGLFTFGFDTRGGMLDDARTGYAPTDLPARLFGADTGVLAVASGNVDDDAAHEMVVVENVNGETMLRVQVLERQLDGTYLKTASSMQVQRDRTNRPSVAIGDFDGDSRGEIVVTSQFTRGQRYVYVFDDALVGHAVLRNEIDVSNSASATSVVAWDMDDDGRDEIALVSDGAIRLTDDATTDFRRLQAWKNHGFDEHSKLIVGDFDGDRKDELAQAGTLRFGGSDDIPSFQLMGFEYVAGAGLKSFGRIKVDVDGFGGLPFSHADELVTKFDAVALDLEGDTIDEVAAIFPTTAGGFPFGGGQPEYALEQFRWDGPASKWVQSAAPGSAPEMHGYPYGAPSLGAADSDADGAEELLIAHVTGRGSRSQYELQIVRVDPDSNKVSTKIFPPVTFNGGSDPRALIMTAGDYDADGFTVASTRRTFLEVADPIPLVVMSAAPTKQGIDQNYGASGTSYSVEKTTREQYEVSSSTAFSVSQGVDIEVLGGLIGGSASLTVERSVEHSHGTAKQISFVEGLHAGHDEDMIVFQGTLYKSYEYQIMSADDPSVVGQLMTFDVPVDSKVYLWTVERYNNEFGAEHAIGPDVLPHTVGDPASYRNEGQTEALLDRYVGWQFPDSKRVAEGTSAARSTEIRLGEQQSTSEQRSYSVTGEMGFKAGIRTFGASRSLTESSMYSVTVSETTSYSGSVGSIRGADYDSYVYDFGMAVYHRGVLADGSNNPIGVEEGMIPFQVITFWTNPVGTAY